MISPAHSEFACVPTHLLFAPQGFTLILDCTVLGKNPRCINSQICFDYMAYVITDNIM